MKINKTVKLHSAILLLFMCLSLEDVAAETRIAVLDFELKDVTLAPRIPAEISRTASIRPMLENELKESGYEVVAIPENAQQQATAGVGYLFDHPDAAAQLGNQYGADYVLVGRLHKPSFLFFYLMAHLVDVKKKALAGEYIYEVKGGEKKLVAQGVEGIAEKITKTLGAAK
ncbi:MAG: DUF2380 domain-containing protein [Methylococcales bacterium]|nr:DUF2380 domain-containing protein [Methylococcales bacterium]